MERLCRFCGQQSTECINLFENKLIEKITLCLPLKFSLNDDLPKQICFFCNEKIQNVFDFIDLIVLTEKKFKTQIPKYSKSLKETVLDNVKQKIYKLPNLSIQKISTNKKTVTSTIVENLGNLFNEEIQNQEEIVQKLHNNSKQLTITKLDEKNYNDKTGFETELNNDIKMEDELLINEMNNVDNCFEIEIDDNVEDTDYDPHEKNDDDLKDENFESKVRKKTKGTDQKIIVDLDTKTTYICITCKEKFLDFESLKEHMKTNLKCKMVNLTCEVCLKICDTKKALYQHSLTHKDKNKYICNECGKSYSNRFNLENHKSSFHGEQLEDFGSVYKCKVCDKQFTKRKELYAHVSVHTKEPSINLCDLCGKCFPSIEKLRSHTRLHLNMPNKFGCGHCDKRFRSQQQVHQHLHVVHTGIKLHSCKQCDKQFVKKDSLQSHAKIHSNEKIYKIPTLHTKLKKHTKTHS